MYCKVLKKNIYSITRNFFFVACMYLKDIIYYRKNDAMRIFYASTSSQVPLYLAFKALWLELIACFCRRDNQQWHINYIRIEIPCLLSFDIENDMYGCENLCEIHK